MINVQLQMGQENEVFISSLNLSNCFKLCHSIILFRSVLCASGGLCNGIASFTVKTMLSVLGHMYILWETSDTDI